jgi:hypothetical protein
VSPILDQLPDLSSMIVSFLAPHLPALLKLGEAGLLKIGSKAMEEVGKDAGESGFGFAKELWARLWPSVEKTPAVLEAAKDIGDAPERNDLKVVLSLQIEKLLKQDKSLRLAMERLIRNSPTQRNTLDVSGNSNIVIGGGATAAHISTYANSPRIRNLQKKSERH